MFKLHILNVPQEELPLALWHRIGIVGRLVLLGLHKPPPKKESGKTGTGKMQPQVERIANKLILPNQIK